MRRTVRTRSVALTTTSLLLISLLLSACAFTQSEFARTASKDGSAFAAAALTLSYLHTGRIPRGYAASSFVNFQSEVSDSARQLASAAGAPDARTLQRPLALVRRAQAAVAAPCLDEGCDWQGQVAVLQAASDALVKVGGG